ncbi:MAG: hypothetical protein HRT73_13865 [Flavobacteriales bacterium]|nr:hypothetical protein [Flavobacteriales bacterium]
MKKLLLIFILLSLPFLGSSQNIGVGASALYNIQSESFGAGARVSIFPNNTLSYVPQFSYYFIGPVSEWTAGLSLELKILRGNTFDFYLLAHGGYNRWTNSENSALSGASPSNWNAEAGAGITTNKCLRPFLEYRYNVKFQETHFQLGLLYIFGCGGDGNGYRNTNRMRKGVVCPAYN